MRLGVFVPNWIGDVVMATPALRALRKHLGDDGEMIGIMRPYVAEVLDGLDWFDNVMLYEKQARSSALDPRLLVKKLRAEPLDRIILFTNSFRTAWMAWGSRVPERIGYVGQFRAALLTQRLKRPRSTADGRPMPTLDAYLHLAAEVGCPLDSASESAAASRPPMELATTAADELVADAAWRRLGLPPGEEVVVLNAGGAFGAAKNWPVEHFAALAKRIVADRDVYVLVNCGPSERGYARQIVARAADDRVVTLAEIDDLPIGLTKAVIRRSRLLVTTDSGPRFFGIAFGKPVVTLFGPTSPDATRTHYDRETCLSLSLDCQPCMERICPLGHHRCMGDLSVESVYAAVERHLAQAIRPRPVVAVGATGNSRDHRSRLYEQ